MIGPACSYVVHEDLQSGAGEGEREGRKGVDGVELKDTS